MTGFCCDRCLARPADPDLACPLLQWPGIAGAGAVVRPGTAPSRWTEVVHTECHGGIAMPHWPLIELLAKQIAFAIFATLTALAFCALG